MVRADEPQEQASSGPRQFATTRLEAGVGGRSTQLAAIIRRIKTLCENYWYPLYAYVRRRGREADEAQDFTQALQRSSAGLSRSSHPSSPPNKMKPTGCQEARHQHRDGCGFGGRGRLAC
jgi:hypothetical protein